jgi:hypothetical protein
MEENPTVKLQFIPELKLLYSLQIRNYILPNIIIIIINIKGKVVPVLN